VGRRRLLPGRLPDRPSLSVETVAGSPSEQVRDRDHYCVRDGPQTGRLAWRTRGLDSFGGE
jgi:hypothetical protein